MKPRVMLPVLIVMFALAWVSLATPSSAPPRTGAINDAQVRFKLLKEFAQKFVKAVPIKDGATDSMFDTSNILMDVDLIQTNSLVRPVVGEIMFSQRTTQKKVLAFTVEVFTIQFEPVGNAWEPVRAKSIISTVANWSGIVEGVEKPMSTKTFIKTASDAANKP